MNKILFVCSLFILTSPLQAQNLLFVKNTGTYPEEVQFSASIPGGKAFFEADQVTYVFYDPEFLASNHQHEAGEKAGFHWSDLPMHAVKVKMTGSHQQGRFTGRQPMDVPIYHFKGETQVEPSPVFQELYYEDAFEGADLRYYQKDGQLKYDIIVRKGTRLSSISFEYEGEEGMELTPDQKEVIIQTSVNEVHEKSPMAFTESRKGMEEIDCRFKLDQNKLSFDLPFEVAKKDLIIDPLLIFSTYSGSFDDNWGFTATYDEAGNLYSGGIAFGANFPGISGPYNGGTVDVSLLKFDSTGSVLLYGIFLGGNDSEVPTSIVVNKNQELIVMGTTGSADFPTTPTAFQPVFAAGDSVLENNILDFNDGTDLYITRFSRNGRSILASTFLGGTGNDGIKESGGTLFFGYGDQYRGEVNLDSAENILIASNTTSDDFPTINAVQATYGGGNIDGVAARLTPDLSTLQWSTYAGGEGEDALYSIKTDSKGNVFVGGGTSSTELLEEIRNDTTANVHLDSNQGESDGFILKISPDGQNLMAGTFLGTPDFDQVYFVDLDTLDQVYGLGLTFGTYPIQPAGVYGESNTKQFIHKLDNNLENTGFSTSFGDSQNVPDLNLTAFLVNECGNLFLSGWGSTLGMPVTSNAFQTQTDNGDFYLMVIEKDAKSLLYATYFGGTGPRVEHVDGGTSRFDKRGIVYQSVCADCAPFNYTGPRSTFPSTRGAWSETNNARNCNNAAFKFDLSSIKAVLETNTPEFDRPGISLGCRPFEVALINRSIGGIEYIWDYGNGNGSTNTVLDTVFVTYDSLGDFPVTLTAIDQNTCKVRDVATAIITVVEGSAIVSNDTTICLGDEVELSVTGTLRSLWYTLDSTLVSGSSVFLASPDTTTTYAMIGFSDNGCEFRDTVTVTVEEEVFLDFEPIIRPTCQGLIEVEFRNLTEGDDRAYRWDFGDGTISNERSPIHVYNDTLGNFNVTLSLENQEFGCNEPAVKRIPVSETLVPNVFTPGTPPENETFMIQSPYPVDLKIFNRWGRLVFEEQDYNNDWFAEGESAGVYYYEVTFQGGDRCNGWVQVLK